MIVKHAISLKLGTPSIFFLVNLNHTILNMLTHKYTETNNFFFYSFPMKDCLLES